MKIIFTGGGTAGHINPALAIANFIRDKHPDWSFIYVGNSDHMEYKLAKAAGYKFIGINVRGFQRQINIRNVINNIQAMGLLFTADQKSKQILKEVKPDLVVGTGGYVTGPIMNAAVKMGINTITHEQNAYPGVTTKLLSKKVDKVLLAVKEAKKYLDPQCDIEVTGNPVRKEILTISRSEARKKLKIKKESKCILSFGGSLGAKVINEVMVDLISKTYKDENVHYIHATGKFGKEIVPQLFRERGVNLVGKNNLDIREYINNMDECLAAADIVICRAGAITLSELEVVGRASILIPSPNVAENHQYYNAKVLSDSGAAILIEEKNLTGDRLYNEVKNLILNPKLILDMEYNAKKLGIIDASDKIYDIIMNLGENKNKSI